jgi:hypothetical protein
MSTSDTTTATINAQWFNAIITALKLSPDEFQIAQGDLVLPQSTANFWEMCDQTPEASVAQYYTPGTLVNFSSQYRTILSDVYSPQNDAFITAMGTYYQPWLDAKLAYVSKPANQAKLSSNPPFSTSDGLLAYFNTWSMEYMDNPSQASNCYTLYSASLQNPIEIGDELIINQKPTDEKAYDHTLDQVKSLLASAPSVSFEMYTSTESSDIKSAWTSSSKSAGGTYFYTTSSSKQDDDFTQTFASSTVEISTKYEHVTAIPVSPLSSGNIKDGKNTYQAWFYPGALTQAYQNDDTTTWQDPDKWSNFFGDSGSLQYNVIGIVVVDGVTQTLTSKAQYSDAEQSYVHSQSSENYGCWPYYVTSKSSSTFNTSTTFNSDATMTVTTNSDVGNPMIIGFLVSALKNEEKA